MAHTLAEAKSTQTSIYLSQYIDFHKYAITFTVTCAIYCTEYTEKDFKSFESACKYFNKMCEKYGMTDKVIW